MEYKLTVFLFMVTILECNGHLSILGDVLSTAREQVQSGVEGVAGAVLGGLNLNFGGHFGFNRHNRPQHVPQTGPEETIVVVVEESSQNDYEPTVNGPPPPYHNQGSPPPHHQQGPPPPNHHQGPPPPHHHQGPPPPHHHRGPPPPHHHQGPPPPPHHHRGPPPQHHNQGPPPPPPYDHHERPYNDHGPQLPEYNGQNQDTYNQNQYNNNQHSGGQENGNNFSGNFNNNGYQQNPQDTDRAHENNDQKYYNPIKEDSSTETAKTTTLKDDLPLFVPLNPDEYVYGGDKINISSPKRDTELTKPAESDDEDFGIDIRLKDE